jgi:hypothetical protein
MSDAALMEAAVAIVLAVLGGQVIQQSDETEGQGHDPARP